VSTDDGTRRTETCMPLRRVFVSRVRFRVLTAASTSFWDIALCRLVEVDRRFRADNGPLKRRPASTTLHGALSQKATIFVLVS
jgi:hypothetical protein